MFFISTFSLRLLTRDHSGWLVVQVGFFPHMMCLESIIPYQLFVFTQLNPYVGLAPLGRSWLCASVIQHNHQSILLNSWMVFLVVILADPMFRLRSYSPYPRVKVCWSLLSNVVFSKSHYLTLLLRTSYIPFFGLHLFLTPLLLRQKEFYPISPVVPGGNRTSPLQ